MDRQVQGSRLKVYRRLRMGLGGPEVRVYPELVHATREPTKMAQFDWFAISGYWAISRDRDLKLGMLFLEE